MLNPITLSTTTSWLVWRLKENISFSRCISSYNPPIQAIISHSFSNLVFPVKTYTPHRDHNLRILSAKSAIKAVLPLDLYPAHKRELISVCLWKITEADGKLNTRYRSERAINGANKRLLQHEHVNTRKHLIEMLLKKNELADHIENLAIGCLVTKAEHQKLTTISLQDPTVEGWERYRLAEVRVYDCFEKKYLALWFLHIADIAWKMNNCHFTWGWKILCNWSEIL